MGDTRARMSGKKTSLRAEGVGCAEERMDRVCAFQRLLLVVAPMTANPRTPKKEEESPELLGVSGINGGRRTDRS